jgi:hypothetical protein
MIPMMWNYQFHELIMPVFPAKNKVLPDLA